MPQSYPKVSVKRCEGGWVISETRKPDKVVTRWQGVLHELHERLYGNEAESSVLRTAHGEFSGAPASREYQGSVYSDSINACGGGID